MTSLRTLALEFCEDVTVTQIVRLAGSKRLILKLFWLFILIISVAALSYQTVELVFKLYQYDKQFDIKISDDTVQPFPAVTVCSLNPYKKSSFDRISNIINLIVSTTNISESSNETVYETNPTLTTLQRTTTTTSASTSTTSTTTLHPTTTAVDGLRVLGKLLNVVNNVVNNVPVVNILVNTSNQVVDLANNIVGDLVTSVNQVVVDVVQTLNQTTGDLEQVLTQAVSDLSHLPSQGLGSLEPLLRHLLQGVGNVAGDAVKNAVQLAATALSSVGKIGGDTVTGLLQLQLLNSIGLTDALAKDLFNLILQLTNINDSMALTSVYGDMLPYILSSLSTQQKMSFGYTAADLLIHCTFANEPCTFQNEFYEWYDSDRGNCFTFNHKKASTQHQSYHAGREHGLKLILNGSQSDYMVNSNQAGMAVMITNPNIAVFPNLNFVYASPNFTMDFVIFYSETTRLGPPYGDCSNDISSPNYFYDGNYTVEGCQATCHQKSVLKECGCADPHYPLPSMEMPNFTHFCNLLSMECVGQVTTNESLKGYDNKLCHCTNPCNEQDFLYETSTTKRVNHGSNASLKDAIVINVYYKNYLKTTYTQKLIYDINAFLSDLGGNTGNILGCSFITIFEFGFLLCILVSCVFTIQHKSP